MSRLGTGMSEAIAFEPFGGGQYGYSTRSHTGLDEGVLAEKSARIECRARRDFVSSLFTRRFKKELSARDNGLEAMGTRPATARRRSGYGGNRSWTYNASQLPSQGLLIKGEEGYPLLAGLLCHTAGESQQPLAGP